MYNAPANQIHYHTTVQPEVHEIKQDIKFQKAADQHHQEEQETRRPIVKQRNRTYVYKAQPNVVHNYTVIKPHVNTETTEVRFNKQEDQVQNKPDTVLPTVNKTVTREQVVTVPGKQIITQPVHQHYIKDKEIHHIYRPVIKKKFVVRKVNVPTPVIQKIPIVRKVQARV